jgi:hypothetical protein
VSAASARCALVVPAALVEAHWASRPTKMLRLSLQEAVGLGNAFGEDLDGWEAAGSAKEGWLQDESTALPKLKGDAHEARKLKLAVDLAMDCSKTVTALHLLRQSTAVSGFVCVAAQPLTRLRVVPLFRCRMAAMLPQEQLALPSQT